MDVIASIQEIRKRLKGEPSIAFVPTMGNLHEGHLSLVRIAQGHGRCVAVSIFVNPLQFGPSEDYATYPRTLQEDCEKLAKLGVDVVFTPDEKELYPVPQQLMVEPPPIGNALEGAFRPGFFRGVATVVLKLFHIVQPQAAVFGKKDYQQLHIVREMVKQLNLPITIIAGETARAADGLALSSRNGYLSPAERAEAPRLYRALVEAKQAIEAGDLDFRGVETRTWQALDSRGWKVDYVAVQHAQTLLPAIPENQDLVILAAAWLGRTRLIDNVELCLKRE